MASVLLKFYKNNIWHFEIVYQAQKAPCIQLKNEPLAALCNTALQQVQCDKYLWHNKLSEPAPAAAPRRHLAAWCLDTLYHIQRAVHSQDGVASGAEIRHKWRLSIRYVHLLAHINVIVGWRGLEIPTIKDLHSNCEIIEASFIWNAIDRSAVWCG